MPNDGLFNDPAEVEEGGEEQPQPESSPGLSSDDVQRMISTATTQLQADNAALQTELRLMRETQNSSPSPAPEPAQTPDEYIDSFTTDAQGTVEKTAQGIVDARIEQMVPLLRQQNDTIHQNLMQSEQKAIEAEFGPTAWTDHFEPTIQARMADLRRANPASLSDPSVISTEVLGVMGLKRNELSEAKDKFTKTATEAKEAEVTELMGRFNMNGMNGGPAPVASTSKELTEAEKDYVASKKIAGETVDIQRLRKVQALKGVSSYEDYQAAMGDTK